MKIYKIADLMKRYGFTTPQGAIKFVQTNLSKINAEVEHAIKKNNKWTFDEEVISIMDALRDTNRITIIEEDSPRLKELTEDNDRLRAKNEQLKKMLIAAQAEIIERLKQEQQLQLKLSSTELKAVENQGELQLQLKSTEAKATETALKLSSSEIEIKVKEQRIKELKMALSKAKETEETLLKLRQRGLIGRILNR